LNRK